MTRVYYKYAIAAIIGKQFNRSVRDRRDLTLFALSVFDVSRPATFEAVLKVTRVSSPLL
jgi:hypothetical protein